MAELSQQLAEAKKQLEILKKDIENIKLTKSDYGITHIIQQKQQNETAVATSTTSTSLTSSSPHAIASPIAMRSRRILSGHFGKVFAIHWAGDSQHLVSASQDGKLMIWNGMTTNKLLSIPLASSWVITCAYEQVNNDYIACGGMDNICSIYRVKNYHQGSDTVIRVAIELVGHQGYLSSCCFVNQQNILTSSGDATCNLWDVERGRPIRVFREHTADVMSVKSSNVDSNIFVTGSCDATAKVSYLSSSLSHVSLPPSTLSFMWQMWDIRAPKRSTLTLRGHASDVNSVCFFPDGYGIGTGSDDRTCKLFDTRCMTSLASFGNENIVAGISSVTFSKSGRLLFGGYEDFTIRGWDILEDPTSATSCRAHLLGHENRVSSIAINPSGDALLSGSWDTRLRIWA